MGKVKPREVLALFAVLALISFALVLTMNPLTIGLSFAALLLAVCYPFMKRYIPIPSWCSAWPSPGRFPWPMLLRPTPCRRWPGWCSRQPAVDHRLRHPVRHGGPGRRPQARPQVERHPVHRHDKRIIGALQLLTLLILLLVGQLSELGSSYYWSLLAAAALFVYQQRLIRERQREACFQAFLNNNYVGALIFAGVVINYL